MGSIALYFLFLLAIAAAFTSTTTAQIGVCYGQLGNNLPNPSKSTELLLKLKAKQVKLYDANPKILNALEGTKLHVSIMVPNELIISISSSQSIADQWVLTNVVPFYNRTMIRYLLVGNEVLSGYFKSLWFYLVPAMQKIKKSIKIFGLQNIKVGTPLAMDVVSYQVFPPSNGTFRSDISAKVMKPLLQFLYQTKSFFFIDVYTYFEWVSNPTTINLDYALLAAQNVSYTDRGSGLVYTNLLDQMLDTVVFAMKKLGYPDIQLFISETGWPSAGDIDQIGANVYNAATYNRNVVKRFTAKPPVGTPARPGAVIPVNIFALYNENEKPGPRTERYFGLLNRNGSHVYNIDLSGKLLKFANETLPEPRNNRPYKGKAWCVIARGASWLQLKEAINFACGQAEDTCRAIRPGGECYKPNSLILHASYAFSAYWAQFRKNGATCFLNGLAAQTTKDPSYLSCKLPSVTL